jgi:hypothetical protein
MADLETAIAIAVEAHRGQTDKAGQPYILHPLRVMLSLNTEQERIVGVMHDVVEDSEITLEDLRARGFPEEVLQALDAVTKRPGESGDAGYEAFVERAGRNPIGRRVKIADLLDNLDLTRLADLGDSDASRLGRYLKALRVLEQAEAEK